MTPIRGLVETGEKPTGRDDWVLPRVVVEAGVAWLSRAACGGAPPCAGTP